MKLSIDVLDNINWARTYLEQADELLSLEQRLGGTDYFDTGEFIEKARKVIHLVNETLLHSASVSIEAYFAGVSKQ